MGLIQTLDCEAPDAELVSTSLWFIAPTQDEIAALGDPFSPNILLFNSEDVSETAGYSILLRGDSFVGTGLFNMRIEVFAADNSGDGFCGWNSSDNHGSVVVNGVGGDFHPPPNGLNFGGWNHLFVASDTGHPGPWPGGRAGFEPPGPGWKIGWIVLNGQIINEFQNPVGNGFAMPVTATESDGSNVNPGTSFSFETGFAGLFAGVPANANQRDAHAWGTPGSVTLRMAEFQMWVGQFIDPTVPANLAKFIASAGAGKIKPVDPAKAAEAFGPQTFLFARDKKKRIAFETNRGTGGAFVKVGTINDFSPGPSG